MSGLWLMPTRRRVPLVKRFLAAAVRLGMTAPGRILVNRYELIDRRDEYGSIELPPGWEIVGFPEDSICETMRAALPLYRDLDWVGTITDDVVPETEGWEQRLLAHEDGKTIVSCNDGSQPKRMAGAIIWPVPIFRAVGYWVPSGFKHCFVDDIWETLGREAKCWKIDIDVVVRHLHPWITGIEDDTHKHSYRADKWANDEALYKQWVEVYRDASISKLRAFIEQRNKEAA